MTLVAHRRREESLFDEEALIREARRLRRRRWIVGTSLAVLFGLGGGLYLVTSHSPSRTPTSPATSPEGAAGGTLIPPGEPTSEVVTSELLYRGQHVVFPGQQNVSSEVWATSLGANPEVRESQYTWSGQLWEIEINGIEYVPNPDDDSAVACTPFCDLVTTPWLKIVPASPDPLSATVRYDPVLAVAAIRRASIDGLVDVGTMRLASVPTTEYRGIITARSMAAIESSPRVGGIYDVILSTYLAQSESAKPVDGEYPPISQTARRLVSIWVDREGLARRIDVSWALNPSASTASSADPESSSTSEHAILDFGAFGKTVSLAPPAFDGVTTIKQPSGAASCQVWIHVENREMTC